MPDHTCHLPRIYAITPEPTGSQSEYFARLLANLNKHAIGLLQFRAKSLSSDRYKRYAAQLISIASEYQVSVMLNAEPALAGELGAVGVHLTEARLMALMEKPVGAGVIVAASCHDATSLQHAQSLGIDFAVLSPVKRTMSHPGVTPLGWAHFGRLVADVRMPVYALGGMGWDDLDTALEHGGHGIAGIGMWC